MVKIDPNRMGVLERIQQRERGGAVLAAERANAAARRRFEALAVLSQAENGRSDERREERVAAARRDLAEAEAEFARYRADSEIAHERSQVAGRLATDCGEFLKRKGR